MPEEQEEPVKTDGPRNLVEEPAPSDTIMLDSFPPTEPVSEGIVEAGSANTANSDNKQDIDQLKLSGGTAPHQDLPVKVNPVTGPMPPVDAGHDLTAEPAISAATQPESGGMIMEDDDLDALFMQEDATATDGLYHDAPIEQQDADVDSLLPGLEFYANENNATPGPINGVGDLTTVGLDARLQLPGSNAGNDGSNFMLDEGIDGQNGTFDSNFDDWFASVGDGEQGAEGHANHDEPQFDDNFFNLD